MRAMGASIILDQAVRVNRQLLLVAQQQQLHQQEQQPTSSKRKRISTSTTRDSEQSVKRTRVAGSCVSSPSSNALSLSEQAHLWEQAKRTRRMAVLMRNLEDIHQKLVLELSGALDDESSGFCGGLQGANGFQAELGLSGGVVDDLSCM